MTAGARERTLADVVAHDSPVPPRRAASIMLVVARELHRREGQGHRSGHLTSGQVLVGDDGTVRLSDAPAVDGAVHDGPTDGDRSGASVGRLWFELLVGRPPLDPSDGFEPLLVEHLSATQCSMIARSCSAAPGHWPSLEAWVSELTTAAGGMAAPLPPRRIAAERRRRAVLIAALAVLILATVVVLASTMRWWDAATTEGGLGPARPPASVQAPRAWS